MSDSRPPLDPAFAAFGVAATVTPAGGAAIPTTILWEAPGSGRLAIEEDPQFANRPRCAVRRDQVAALPVGSIILAPPLAGGTPVSHVVDRVDDLDPQVFTAIVHGQ